MEGLAPLSNAPHQLPAVLSVLCAHLFVHGPLHDIDAPELVQAAARISDRHTTIVIFPRCFRQSAPQCVLQEWLSSLGIPPPHAVDGPGKKEMG